MTEERKSDPLEGFHFDDFDQETKTLRVMIHRFILANPRQKEALLARLTEVLAYDDAIDRIDVAPRD